VAHALADPLRLTILQRLLDGSAAVSELVALTGEAQSKVSNHLSVLRDRGFVDVTRLGRQRVYEISDPAVARLVESLAVVAGGSPTKLEESPALARARTCYDHLAGRLGVAIFDALMARGAIAKSAARHRGPVALGPEGPRIFGRLGIDVDKVRRERRQFATTCDDWTERRPHLGGALGAALWARSVEQGWVVQRPGARVVVITERGRRNFKKRLRLSLDDAAPPSAPRRR
jgi:DNA-binding transcriptional ArsR family regulator